MTDDRDRVSHPDIEKAISDAYAAEERGDDPAPYWEKVGELMEKHGVREAHPEE